MEKIVGNNQAVKKPKNPRWAQILVLILVLVSSFLELFMTGGFPELRNYLQDFPKAGLVFTGIFILIIPLVAIGLLYSFGIVDDQLFYKKRENQLNPWSALGVLVFALGLMVYFSEIF